MKSDPNVFEIKSALHRENGAGDSFVLHTTSLRGSLNTSGSFVNNGGSFMMNDVASSGSYVNGGNGSFVNNNNNSIGGFNAATFGASGSFLNLHNLTSSNGSGNGSFVNNNPTPVAQMPPPRPVKRTPVNSTTNHTNPPHSAPLNGYASGLQPSKPPGTLPLMRRRRYEGKGEKKKP